MGSEMHLQPAELLRQIKQIQTAVDEQARQLVAESFTGTDEAKTVEVTLDGRQWLTNLYLQDGLLRLGIETVAQRINEAIQNAQAVATAAAEVEQERFIESLAGMASSMPLPDVEKG
ncbi:YbaB/EbfC family nucleoid-associated protein [Mycobacterium sp. 050128]|uniref:YbaB/EbfC family nucleoid-associated protein n=1 Tax=Mycobacterium sp. 050128 TaxID=3096112 RepID=UPI002ED896D1